MFLGVAATHEGTGGLCILRYQGLCRNGRMPWRELLAAADVQSNVKAI